MAGRSLGPIRHARAGTYRTDRTSIESISTVADVSHFPLIAGPGRIEGISTFDGAPGPARVLLMQDMGSKIVRETWSGSDGAYAFGYLDTGQTFTLIGVDQAENYNSVLQARMTPGVPP